MERVQVDDAVFEVDLEPAVPGLRRVFWSGEIFGFFKACGVGGWMVYAPKDCDDVSLRHDILALVATTWLKSGRA